MTEQKAVYIESLLNNLRWLKGRDLAVAVQYILAHEPTSLYYRKVKADG
jgi:hypothetical protein